MSHFNLPPHLAFIPIDRRLALADGRILPEQTEGAALLADVSGFTALTQTLVTELGPKQGAEAVLTYINPVYEQLITVLHRYRGCVIGFVGDAITCWFDEVAGLPPAPLRALACGLEMQTALRPFANQQTPRGTSFHLSIKVAIAAGPVRRLLVGDPGIKLLDTIAGSTLTRMAETETQAQTGEVVVSPEVVKQFKDRLVIDEWRGDVAIVNRLAVSVPTTPWPELSTDQLPLERVRSWLLPAIYEQLQTGETYSGDLRPVTPLMLRFGGLDFDHNPADGQKLNDYVQWVQGVVHQYGGTLLQLTLGDKGAYLYASFGAPTAHEDDARRALTAALQLQAPPATFDWLPPVQIGITQGAVWTGAYGASSRCTYGAMGPDVNLAARLMMKAQPGQTLVSAHLHRQTGFRYQHIDDIQYKGFEQPLATYALLDARTAAHHIFEQPLIGRASELDRLQQFAQTIMANRQAGIAFIYGDAGVGKSHLTYGLNQRLGDRVNWLVGQSDAIVREAFHPFVYLLKQYFQQMTNVPDGTNKANFQAQLDDLLLALDPLPGSERLQAELRRTASSLAALFGLRWPDSLYEQLDAEGRYQNSIIALGTLLQAECWRQPVILELEDAHWFDDASRELLTALTRQLANLPCLILVTARYRDDGSRPSFDLAPQTPTLTLDLQTLSAPALRELAQTHLDLPIDDRLYNLLLEKTGANPFFAQQILHYLQENDLIQIVTADGQPTASLAAALPNLPLTLDGLLVARLDRLTQQVKTVVQTAAVLGREFELRLLSQVLQQDIMDEITIAEQQQIWSLFDELRHIFKHALLRDAAYEMQLVARRRELHQLAASALETLYADDLPPHYAEIAYHYEAAYQLGLAEAQTPACRYLRLAGEQAAARYENRTAIDAFSRALALTEDAVAQIELLLAREAIYHLLGERAAQVVDHERLAALTAMRHEPAEEAILALRRARYATGTSNFKTAVPFAEKAVQLARVAGDIALESEAQTVWGSALTPQGEFAQARHHYQAALRLAQRAENRRRELAALTGLGRAAAQQTDYPTARTHLEQALALARATAARRREGFILNNLGNVYLITGDLVAAKERYEEALALRRAIGDRPGEGVVLGNLGRVARAQGDSDSARRYYETNLAITREIGDRYSETFSLIGLGLLAKEQEDYDNAHDYYEAALAISQEIGNKLGVAVACHNLGSVHKTYGDYDNAQRRHQEALIIFREIGDRHGEWLTLSDLGDIAATRTNYDSARSHYERALTIQREISDGKSQAATLTRLGDTLAADHNWSEAASILQEALAGHEKSGNLALLLETRAALARLYLAQGDVAGAQAQIDSLLDDPVQEADARFYFTGYQVLDAAGEIRAHSLLEQAYRKLQSRAGRITDEATRRAFLENVPWHRQIVEAWHRQQANGF